MQIVNKPREKLRYARNISSYDGWNVPKITQPYTRRILDYIFYCRGDVTFLTRLSHNYESSLSYQ